MAKTVKALITPEVLKSVREKQLKLEIEFAAEKSKVKPEQLSTWEAGTDTPSFAQLKRIANAYKTHVSIFYLPAPPDSFEPLADHRRLPKPITSDEVKVKREQSYRLNVNVVEAHERRETLIEYYGLLEESPPEVTLELNETDTPEQAAREVRDFLQFNTGLLKQYSDDRVTLKFWRNLVEERGVLVCQTSVNTHLSIELSTVRGFCIAQKPFPVIVVNPKDSPYGRIFTIVHELVHIGLGKSVMQNLGFGSFPDRNPTEEFCNQVAAEVLVPTAELSRKINLKTLETDLSQFSKHFRVSPEVIMRRLQTLGYISRQEYQAYRNTQLAKYKDSKPTGGPIPYHTRLLNVAGEHFARTAFTAYYEQKITLADLASSFSKCDPKHIPKLESNIFA